MHHKGNRSGVRLRHQLHHCLVSGVVGLSCSFSTAADLAPQDVLNMSPEDLARLQVTSVSRRPELLSQAAASVYVITAEDIRRSSAITLTEALRLAPTLYIANDNGIPAFVGARGQTMGVYTGPNKLLVLLDGRSIYNHIFSGVLWDSQEVVLEDIERIEVISGPAGVLWGVNAVQGVINIITKHASQTQGVLASIGRGDRARDGVLRYGGRLWEEGHYRAWGKYSGRDSNWRQSDGSPVNDDSHKLSTGARLDFQRGPHVFSAQMNALAGSQGQPMPGTINVNAAGPVLPRVEMNNFSLLGRWGYAPADGSNLSLQVYFDHATRSMQPATNDNSNIVDIELQKNEAPIGAHKLTWGGNLRVYRASNDNSVDFAFYPEVATQRWLSAFLQDEVSLSERWRLTAGSRIERGPYGTLDFLPTLRLSAKLSEGQILWGALSRGARSPARFDADFRFPATGPVNFIGNRNLKSETVDVLELGFRHIGQRGSASITVFRNFYDRLMAVAQDSAGDFSPTNGARGKASGVEMWGDARITPAWKLAGGFTLMTENYADRPGITTTGLDDLGGSSPRHTAQLRSSWNLAEGKELDLIFRRSGAIGGGFFVYQIPAYNALDVRFGWKLGKNLELAVIGQNLAGTEHAEWGDPALRAAMNKRIYTRLTWRQ